MGAVLFQVQDGERRIISYASAKFSGAERRYHCNEQECLAIIWAIRHFRPYLEDKPFTLYTDSKVLTWLDKFKDTRDKLTRWALLLQEFSFKVIHCPGKSNELPDVLSRNPDINEQEKSFVPDEDRLLPPDDTPYAYIIELNSLFDKIRIAQHADKQISSKTKKFLRLVLCPEEFLSKDDKHFLNQYDVLDGSLWIKVSGDQELKIVVPASLTKQVIHEYHDARTAGHPGFEETLRAIKKNHFWPRMSQEIKKLCALLSHMCMYQESSFPNKWGVVQELRKKPWECLALDLMGPYPTTPRKKRYLLVITDCFTKWIEAFAIPDSSAKTIVSVLDNEVFSRWGYPREIITDSGRQFTGNVWQDACAVWDAQHCTTPIYHPQANPTERKNQDIKKGLRLHLDETEHRNWDLLIPTVLFQLRKRTNAATGVTPGYAVTGHDLATPGEWRNSGLLLAGCLLRVNGNGACSRLT
ncbi:unnamed protein product, partial [Trichogramma brassicae]